MSDPGNESPPEPTRRTMLALLGGSATVGLAGCSAVLDGGGTDTPGDTGTTEPPGDETDTGTPESEGTNADKAQAAWERIQENPEPDAADLRTGAHIEIEEAIRDSVIMLCWGHDIGERCSYSYVDAPKVGALGGSHQQHHQTTLENDTELDLRNSSHNYIDPIESDDEASSTVITQVYERLVEYPNGVVELENQLLDEFEVSEDGLTYTFTIKEGVQFHSGDEVTADDFVYSWRRLAESEHSARANFLLSPADGVGVVHETDDEDEVVPDSLALEVLDDYTFEMEVQSPKATIMDILTYTAFSVVPEGIVGDIEGYDGEEDHQTFRQEMADGTGPFEFDSFELNEELRLTRFGDYHRETANVESVHYTIVEDQDAQFTLAMEQNLDIFTIPTSYRDSDLIEVEEEDERGRQIGTYGPVENDETLDYLAVPQLSIRYYGFNASHVPPAVRKAFAYVLDQTEMVNDVFDGTRAPAYSFTPPSIFPGGIEAYEEFVDEHPYSPDETDLEGAQQVLEEAGITEDDPFSLTATIYAGGDAYAAGVELLRDKLAGNGIEVDLDEAQFSALQEQGENGELEMYSLGWGWSYQDVAYGHFPAEPENTNTDLMPDDANGYYLDWQTELEEEA